MLGEAQLPWSILQTLYHNWALTTAVCTVAILIFVPTLVVTRYVQITLRIVRSTEPPLTRHPLDYERLSGDYVTFPAADGTQLDGMLIRAGGAARRGLVLFAHEYCADMHSCARYCRALVEAGFDIFTFDFRGERAAGDGSDQAPRQWVTDRDLDDIDGAIAWVRGWLRDNSYPEEFGMMGISRGACAVVLAAERTPQARAVVVDGVFSTDDILALYIRRWADIFVNLPLGSQAYPDNFWRGFRWLMMHFARRRFGCRFPSVRKALQRMSPRPILFIHGEKDSYVPVDHSRQLYVYAPQPKYFWVARDAKHNQAVATHARLYAELTRRFFEHYLSRPEMQLAGEASPEALASPFEDLLAAEASATRVA